MKHGFIGFGHIAHALYAGLAQNPSNTFLYISKDSRDEPIEAAADINELALWADVLWLCVKPQHTSEVFGELAHIDLSEKILVSPVAGLSISALQKHLGTNVPIIRIMPNLALAYGHSVTAYCASEENDIVKHVQASLETMGTVVRLKEKQFDLFTALFGSGPAFLLRVLQVFETQTRELGISEEKAAALVLELLAGTTAYLRENREKSITKLIEQVASKGGVTEAGLAYFDDNAVGKKLEEMLRVAERRSEELDN